MPAETCGDPDCLICFPLRTMTGREVTADHLDELAAWLAVHEYDVSGPEPPRGGVT